MADKRILDKQENVLYWLEDGRVKAWLPEPPPRTSQEIEFGLIKNGVALLNRSSYHTYIHKDYDRAPGKESISFSRFVILTNMYWGFRIMKLNVKTKQHGHIKCEIPVKDWMQIAQSRKHPCGKFETQSDVLVEDLLAFLKNVPN